MDVQTTPYTKTELLESFRQINHKVTDSFSASGVFVCRRSRADSANKVECIGCSRYSRSYFSRSRANGKATSGA